MQKIVSLLVFLVMFSLFSTSAYASCEHFARNLTNIMNRNAEVLGILRIAERLNNAAPQYTQSSMKLSELLTQAEILRKYLDKKPNLLKNPSSSFFNVERKCPRFNSLFNTFYMDVVIDAEFDQFLLSTENLPVKRPFSYKNAFKGGDVKATPYFKFENVEDVFNYIENGANNIINNEQKFREAIALRFTDKANEIEIQKKEIQQLKERIKEEESINQTVEDLAKQKALLEKKLRQTKLNNKSVDKPKTVKSTVNTNANISVTKVQAEAIVKLIRAYGYSCNSLSSAIQSSYDGSFSVTCNNWQYRYDIEDVGGNWVVTVD